MKLGLHISDFTWQGGAPELRFKLADIAKRGEDGGVDRISVMDHVWQIGHIGPPEHEMLEAYTALGWLAAKTDRVKLLTMVTAVVYREPGLLAKAVTTLDVLSGGRAILGIGSGWLEEEFSSLGLDFHTRGARTDESIKSLRALWSEDSASFHGKHFNFGPVKCFPKPIQKGGVPIHIGGHSPAAAKRAGRYGDGFFPALAEIPKLKELFALMKSQADKAGRDASKIELSCMGRPRVEELKALEGIGVSRVVIAPPAFDAEGLTRGLEKLHDDVISKI